MEAWRTDIVDNDATAAAVGEDGLALADRTSFSVLTSWS